ncbi:NmrA family transcriptional regulator [Massilia sp. JS1662]|nr:NmrA family NAD(P)-binding protein [Massilia sp. JS1662]KGF80676.1 NmrA family transcriptional regulator [Massilia sp. JS1662]
MYAITGITGKVGGALARTLIEAGRPVRAVVRDPARAHAWAALGCEVAVAHMDDADALAAAFRDAEGVFILPPSEFDPAPGFPEARRVIDAVRSALNRIRPPKVVCLSTIGAQALETNLLTQRTLMEDALRTLPVPVTFLRPGWFMENAAWDVASARDGGIVHSFLQPLDKPVPMVATADVGRVAAGLLQESWQGVRTVALEGPRRIAPDDVARTFARILGRPVRAQAVPRETWETLFLEQGMRHPLPRIRMLDGFNEGWIEFSGEGTHLRGDVELETVLRGLVA